MSSAVYVEEAADWAHQLTLARVRKPGDYERAMRSLVEGDDATGDRKVLHATGYATLWGFRFRRPKRVFADVYFELKHAYEAMREHQLKKLEEAVAQAKATGDRPAYLDAAEAVAVAARGMARGDVPKED